MVWFQHKNVFMAFCKNEWSVKARYVPGAWRIGSETEDGPGSNAVVGKATRWDLPLRVGARILAEYLSGMR